MFTYIFLLSASPADWKLSTVEHPGLSAATGQNGLPMQVLIDTEMYK